VLGLRLEMVVAVPQLPLAILLIISEEFDDDLSEDDSENDPKPGTLIISFLALMYVGEDVNDSMVLFVRGGKSVFCDLFCCCCSFSL
jgi:hypothetical protein